MMSKNAQNRSKWLEIARILWLDSARTQICVLTVCQQQRWQVLEHCANSRIRAGVGPKSVLTVDVSVLTLERRPCTSVHSCSYISASLPASPSSSAWRLRLACAGACAWWPACMAPPARQQGWSWWCWAAACRERCCRRHPRLVAGLVGSSHEPSKAVASLLVVCERPQQRDATATSERRHHDPGGLG